MNPATLQPRPDGDAAGARLARSWLVHTDGPGVQAAAACLVQGQIIQICHLLGATGNFRASMKLERRSSALFSL